MDDSEIEKICDDNDREWRKHILRMQVDQSKRIEKIQKDLSGLKVKVAAFASIFGIFGAYIKAKIMGMFGG